LPEREELLRCHLDLFRAEQGQGETRPAEQLARINAQRLQSTRDSRWKLDGGHMKEFRSCRSSGVQNTSPPVVSRHRAPEDAVRRPPELLNSCNS
jgi:hypothetical protein